MTSRERILAALAHTEPDRVPRDLGGTESSGMTACALHHLQRHLDLNDPPTVFEPYQYVAYIRAPLQSRLKIDTQNLTPGPRQWQERANPAGFTVLLPETWNEEFESDGTTVVRRTDGTIAARRPANGYYFDPVNAPLQTIDDPAMFSRHRDLIFSFDWPAFADETLDGLRERASRLYASNGCIVFNLCCHILAGGQLLRGYETFMVDLMTNERLVRSLLDLLLEGYLRRIDRLAPLLRDVVDVLLLNDDLGTQNGPMLAPATYRKLIKPYQAALFAHAKKAFGCPLLFHSCGAVRSFIPDLIELGIDALNPVQLSADGMELKALKQDFGANLTFWGGGVDTQSILNRGTATDVRDAVRQNVDILAPGGGFVFCQVHNIQPDVSPENVVAMFDALDDYGSC